MISVASALSDLCTQGVLRSPNRREDGVVGSLSRRSVTLGPNRPLIGEGEIGVELYCVERGWAYRFRDCTERGRQILDFILPGEMVGLQSALLGCAGHSVRSLTPLHVTVFDT